ncbi:MAG: iron ABC transporter permease [Chlorobiota bacterium]|nr:iron ABC transporter permease [Chlorobiota bacterium]QQS65829.1 MAG: iron ABC transporter permease [Chlorobiota bacterium]
MKGIVLLSFVAIICLVIGSNNVFVNGLNNLNTQIIFDLRLPRIVLSISIGASLAFCGAVFQALLRNPLAEPYILGISNGCSIGAMIGLYLGLNTPFVWLFSFLTGGLVIILVLKIANKQKASNKNESLLIAGVMISALSAGIIFLLLHILGNNIRNAIQWMLGDLSSIDKTIGYFSFLLFIVVSIFSKYIGNILNAFSLGEEEAITLGLNTVIVRKYIYILVSLIIGISVSMCGAIGFIGLVVPHIVRYKFGSDNKILLPLTIILGGLFLLISDTIARVLPMFLGLNTGELPVGAVTALIGAPIFIFFSRKSHS